MKKKRQANEHLIVSLPDNDISSRAIHIIKIDRKSCRLYSDTLKSLGTFRNTKSAIAVAKRIKKSQRMIIVIHDYCGDVTNIIRPDESGIDTSETTVPKGRKRPSRVSALTI